VAPFLVVRCSACEPTRSRWICCSNCFLLFCPLCGAPQIERTLLPRQGAGFTGEPKNFVARFVFWGNRKPERRSRPVIYGEMKRTSPSSLATRHWSLVTALEPKRRPRRACVRRARELSRSGARRAGRKDAWKNGDKATGGDERRQVGNGRDKGQRGRVTRERMEGLKGNLSRWRCGRTVNALPRKWTESCRGRRGSAGKRPEREPSSKEVGEVKQRKRSTALHLGFSGGVELAPCCRWTYT
jgi:hypothetical protein